MICIHIKSYNYCVLCNVYSWHIWIVYKWSFRNINHKWKKNLKYNDASWYSALIFSFFPENMLVITMVIIKGSSILRNLCKQFEAPWKSQTIENGLQRRVFKIVIILPVNLSCIDKYIRYLLCMLLLYNVCYYSLFFFSTIFPCHCKQCEKEKYKTGST